MNQISITAEQQIIGLLSLKGAQGNKGDTGVGIVSIIPDYHLDGSATLTITLGDETTYEVEIPAPKQGRGIETVVARKEGNMVILTLNYNDGTSEEVSFESTPSWTTGNSKPGDGFGYDGDYYFDISHDIIYIKENGIWNVAVDFNTNAAQYSVIFELNDTTAEPAEFTVGQRSYRAGSPRRASPRRYRSNADVLPDER